MKAIQVKFLGATDFKGARVKAFTEGGNSLIESYRYESNSYVDQALEVAQNLMTKLGWDNKITGVGMLPNGDYAVTIGVKQ